VVCGLCNGLASPFLTDAGAERKFFVLSLATWSVSPLNTAQEQERIKNFQHKVFNSENKRKTKE
jgi:hypothetical protein